MLRKLMIVAVLAALATTPLAAQDYVWEPWTETDLAQDVEDSGLTTQTETTGSTSDCWDLPGCQGDPYTDGISGLTNCSIRHVDGWRILDCVNDTAACTMWEYPADTSSPQDRIWQRDCCRTYETVGGSCLTNTLGDCERNWKQDYVNGIGFADPTNEGCS